jgi:DNA-directed RNA polymerase subunit omega
MARITVEDCLTKETNRFALIHLSSKRTKQLLQGASVVLGEACDNKPVVTSLREIAEGKVRFMTQEEMDRLRELGLEEQVPGLEEAALQRAAAERAAKLAAAQEQAAAEKALAEEADVEDEKPSRNGNSENGHHATDAVSPEELAEIADDLVDDEDDEDEVIPAAAAEEGAADAADSEGAGGDEGSEDDDSEDEESAEDADKKTPGGEENF